MLPAHRYISGADVGWLPTSKRGRRSPRALVASLNVDATGT
jgi:hypothetical protein